MRRNDMELIPVGNKLIFPKTGRHENLPLILVEKILAIVLSEDGEEIRVKGSFKSFLYDTKARVQIGKSLKTNVLERKVKQQDNTIEINLNGNIETAESFLQTYNLYFFMWWDHTQASPLKKRPLQKPKAVLLPIHPTSISDSVFELDLYRRNKFHQQKYLGRGRGYLVFSQTS
jgi:hypothetical protein